jgi:hypothetical protein
LGAKAMEANPEEHVRVKYEGGRFLYHNDETGASWFREAGLTRSLVRRHERLMSATSTADKLASEVAREASRESRHERHMSATSTADKLASEVACEASRESDESGESKASGAYSRPESLLSESAAASSSASSLAENLLEDLLVGGHSHATALSMARAEVARQNLGVAQKGDADESKEVRRLKEILRDLERINTSSCSWVVPIPGTAEYSFLTQRRQFARFLWCHCPQISRDFTSHNWPEVEPYVPMAHTVPALTTALSTQHSLPAAHCVCCRYVLNELARKGAYFDEACRRRPYPDSLEKKVDMWIEMLLTEVCAASNGLDWSRTRWRACAVIVCVRLIESAGVGAGQAL